MLHDFGQQLVPLLERFTHAEPLDEEACFVIDRLVSACFGPHPQRHHQRHRHHQLLP